MHEAIYPDPASPARIPVVVIIDNAAAQEEYGEDLGWVPENDPRPVIKLRAREARSLAGEISAAIERLEKHQT